MPTMQNKIMKEAENKVMTNSRGLASLKELIRISTPNTRKNSDSKRTMMFLIRIRIVIQKSLPLSVMFLASP
jgi:hypothetical protein